MEWNRLFNLIPTHRKREANKEENEEEDSRTGGGSCEDIFLNQIKQSRCRIEI